MNNKQDIPTKEKILQVSIDLFAEKGYKEVSVREIAKAVGIKASSLYKHYENKEDILESIFTMFREKMGQTAFPQKELKQYVNSVSPEKYFYDSFALFKKIMWTPLFVKIARIITIEQRRSQSVRKFFLEELIEKPNRTLQTVLELMIENGSIGRVDSRVAAEEYASYIVYLYFEQNFLKENLSLEEIDRKMMQHNDFFVNTILNKKEENKK